MKINKDLLKKILLVDRESRNEYPMINFIWNHLHQIPNLTFELDHYGNLFITKNTTEPEYYPCLLAHMDCIKTWNGNRTIKEIDGVWYGKNLSDNTQAGLSADDACGIYAALEILQLVDNLKICFTTEEEIGAVGAGQAAYNIDFFANVSYFLQADRKGSSDLINHTNGIEVCSKEFLKLLHKPMKKFGYKTNYGTFTDVGVLVEEFKISGCNISCGYKFEHTSREQLVLKDLENCINFMLDILSTVPSNKQYEVEIKSYYDYYRQYYRGKDLYDSWENADFEYYSRNSPSESDQKDDDWRKSYDPNWMPCDTCRTFDCMNCTKIQSY